MTENEVDTWRGHPYYGHDPLPDIKPALLNSLDIRRYVDLGCLLESEFFEPHRLKPASYEMKFLGDLYDWQEHDGRLEKRCRSVSPGERITLLKNSISYLWTEECLRLPEYIAARFNLRIREVHKGILLGTGPLIDPGFGGRIFVPLHNLTDTDYVLTGGDGIIWVEFTKVSANDYWLSDTGSERPVNLVAFPEKKVIEHPYGYLVKAGAAGGVQSAFKGELDRTTGVADRATAASEDAEKRVGELESQVRKWGIGGVIGGAVAVAGLVISAYSLTFPVMDKVHGQASRLDELEKSVKEIQEGGHNTFIVGAGEDAGGIPKPVEEAGSDERELAEGKPRQSRPGESANVAQGA